MSRIHAFCSRFGKSDRLLVGGFPARWIGALCAALIAPAPATALTFDAAVALAAAQTPLLQAADAKVEAARQALIPADALPDPKLAVAIDNLPISGPDRFHLNRDFMTMQRLALLQDFPHPAKREARVATAQARLQRSEAEQQVVALTLQREAALAWIKRHALERQLALLDDLALENRQVEQVAQAQWVAGRTVDSLLPRQEAALLAERRADLTAQRMQAVAALQRWIGAPAAAPLEGEPRLWPLRPDLLSNGVVHPELRIMDAAGQLLTAEVREATAQKSPDLALELAYQRRGAPFGDMISLQLIFDLPWFAHRRQDPKIAAKLAERDAVLAEREAMRREHAALLQQDWAELQRLEQLLELGRNTRLPLAEEKIALAVAAYRGGKGSLQEVLAARRERLEWQLKLVAWEGERAAANTRLHFASRSHLDDNPVRSP